MNTKCKARTKSGKPCRAVAVKVGLCTFHANPQRAAELGRIGGRKNRHYPDSTDPIPTNPPKSADDVRSLLAETMASVHARRLDHKVGVVLASLGQGALGAIEIADLEGRVKALEKRIANTEQ